MTIETQDDVIALKRIGRIVSSVLHSMLAAAEPGLYDALDVPLRPAAGKLGRRRS